MRSTSIILFRSYAYANANARYSGKRALTISIPKSQLDYNHDGIFSNKYEGISLTEVVKNNAFTATTTQGIPFNANMFAYKANIPEPSLIGLAMIGILGYNKIKSWFKSKRYHAHFLQ